MPAKITYAIGDIHGCYTMLNNLLKSCMQHCGEHEFHVVFLGDYVDRGTRSREVVELLMRTQTFAPRRVTCLRGNHDELLVDAAAGGDPAVWLANGGDATLRSYGVERASEIPRQHLDWMAALPLSSSDAKRFFVHAGVRAGHSPRAADQGVAAVDSRAVPVRSARPWPPHRARPYALQKSGRPDLRANRLNVDTGACFGGPLTAAVFDDKTIGPRAFITDDGTITRAPEIRVADDA